MDFFDVVMSRRSVRMFKKDRIEPEVMTQLLRAIRTAPTAGNLQAYQVYLVDNRDKIKALARAALGQSCVSDAAAVLVFCTDAPRSAGTYGERGRQLYCVQDATIAATIAHLAAAALGLGSVMVGAFTEAQAAKVINSPDHLRPILMLPVGYPAEQPLPASRRTLDDLVVRI